MAYTMKLTDGAQTAEFAPEEGFKKPDAYREVSHRAISGKEYTYQFYANDRWELKIYRLAKAKAAQVNTWRENNTELDFYPDLINNPTTKYNVTIQNKTAPLAKMEGPQWDAFFSGTLLLEKTS